MSPTVDLSHLPVNSFRHLLSAAHPIKRRMPHNGLGKCEADHSAMRTRGERTERLKARREFIAKINRYIFAPMSDNGSRVGSRRGSGFE